MRYEVHIVRNGGAKRHGQLGIDWGAILGNTIAQGVNFGLSEVKSLTTPHPGSSTCTPPSGCFQCQMKGQGAIAGCIDSISTQWIAAQQQRDAGLMSDVDLAAYTQGIISGLANPQFFTPQSDSYLNSAKAVFQQRLGDINARLSAASSTSVTPSPSPIGTTTNGGATTPTTTPPVTNGWLPWPSLISTTPAGDMQILGLPLTTALAIAGLGLGIWAVVEN